MFIKFSNKIKSKSANSEVIKLWAFNRKYARELNCCERYHMRELMSFHFIFVANFIHNKTRYTVFSIPMLHACIACYALVRYM